MPLRSNRAAMRMVIAVTGLWLALYSPLGMAQESLPGGPNSLKLFVAATPWGQLLLVLSAGVLITIVLCTMSAGRAFRSGSARALKSLPDQLDADGLMQVLQQEESVQHPSSALRRALRVGLVAGRGGLLLSKSAVLAAWESQKSAFRMWPRVMAALGVISLALSILAAISRIPDGIRIWRQAVWETGGLPDHGQMLRYLDILNQAHALFFWGLTNFFIALSLFFIFDRIIQVWLNRTTTLLIQYLGNSVYREAAQFSPPSGLPLMEEGGASGDVGSPVPHK